MSAPADSAVAGTAATGPGDLPEPDRSQLTRSRVRAAWLFLTPMILVVLLVAAIISLVLGQTVNAWFILASLDLLRSNLDVKAGDKVLFGKYSGTEIKVDGEELLVMREDDIMAIIES